MDEQQPGLVGWFKGHSTIIAIVIIGLVAGIAFLKKPQSSSSSAAVPLSATGDYSGLATDSQGRPIIYRDVSDVFINENKTVNYNGTQPVASSPPSTPSTPGGPVEHPIEPGTSGGHTGSSGGSSSSSSSSSGGTYGILGPNAKVDFAKFTYNGGLPIPAPKGSKLVQGSFNRVWVIYPGANTQDLLTSGTGPPSAYLTYPIGATVYVPASSGTSSGSTNQQNSYSQSNSNVRN